MSKVWIIAAETPVDKTIFYQRCIIDYVTRESSMLWCDSFSIAELPMFHGQNNLCTGIWQYIFKTREDAEQYIYKYYKYLEGDKNCNNYRINIRPVMHFGIHVKSWDPFRAVSIH